MEKQEDVRFRRNGEILLAGRLFGPNNGGKHPAIILAHGSGPQIRESMLPFARFLVRRGVAVLGNDKRGVAESTGDWNTASIADLAGDVAAAFN
jgi:alpha-beta hydrolase superfamily lysophospholipase